MPTVVVGQYFINLKSQGKKIILHQAGLTFKSYWSGGPCLCIFFSNHAQVQGNQKWGKMSTCLHSNKLYLSTQFAIGIDPRGWGIYFLQYLTRGGGLAYVISSPPMLWIANNILTIFTKIQPMQVNRFCFTKYKQLIFNDSSKILSEMSSKMQNLGHFHLSAVSIHSWM